MTLKRVPLTKAEKQANLAQGLTALGKLPNRLTDKRNKAPVGRGAGHIKDGDPLKDYRCTGLLFTPSRKNRYLAILAATGEEALARAEVGVSYHTVHDHKAKDPLFRDAIDEAYRQHASVYAREMHRRGVLGVEEPVFGSQGNNMGSGVVGKITRYSDRLLMEQAKRFNKDYTPRQVVESTNKTTIEGRPQLGLESLSPESREDLRRILEREAQRAPAAQPTAEAGEPDPEDGGEEE